MGNLTVLFLYVFKFKKRTEPVPILFITNLAISDLLMAVYILIIGSADIAYRGSYAKNAEEWLRSSTCFTATFLCCISSLMSVLMMVMISIDRYIYIAFPYSTKRISEYSAKIIILALWFFCIIFIGIPVVFGVGADGDLRLHEYTSICMASNRINEYYYAWLLAYTSITLICWLFTCILYSHMLIVIHRTSSNANNSSNDADKSIALRLFAIVLTDFLSWFPYYLYTIYTMTDSNAFLPVIFQFSVVLALPINSAINPFLYTLTSPTVTRLISRKIRYNSNRSSCFHFLFYLCTYKRKNQINSRCSNADGSSGPRGNQEINVSAVSENINHQIKKPVRNSTVFIKMDSKIPT